MFYYLLLALHLLAIFVWISSFFYLYRLNVVQADQNSKALFEEAYFIYKKVASPALLAVALLGITLLSLNRPLLEMGFWIYLKFFVISLMILMHFSYKINLNLVQKSLKQFNKKVIVSHIYSIFVMLAFVIYLTKIKPF